MNRTPLMRILGVGRAGMRVQAPPSPPAPTSARRRPRPRTGPRSDVRRVRARHAVHHQVGGGEDQVGGRLLHRWRRHHRVPERAGDRRRLHVGGVVPRHLCRGDGRRLRRADLLDRLPRRLAGRDLPARRAAAQPRQVHLRRRRRVPLRADAGARVRGLGHAGRRRLLPDRADGRRRAADQAAVRPRLLDRRRHRRRADDGLRAVRRHDGDHLGADHQGLPAARRRHLHGPHGVVELRLQPRSDVRQGGRGQDRHRDGRRQAGRRRGRGKASRSWARAASSRTRSRRSASAWR